MKLTKLSQDIWPLLPDQKPMDMPKVGGYIKDIYLKLITNNQIIETEEYDVIINQIPYNESYFKMMYDEDNNLFKFETLYRIDYVGKKFNAENISINATIKGIVPIINESSVDIESIKFNYFYDDTSIEDIDKKKEFLYEYIDNYKLKDLLLESLFYQVEVISIY